MALTLSQLPTWEQLQANPALKQKFKTVLNDPLAYQDQYDSSVGILKEQVQRANDVERASAGVNTGSIGTEMLGRALNAGFISGTIAPDSNQFTNQDSIKQRFGGSIPSFVVAAKPYVSDGKQFGVDEYYKNYGATAAKPPVETYASSEDPFARGTTPSGSAPGVTPPVNPLAGFSGGNAATSSIVDYLSSIKQPADFASRAKLAAQAGIQNYQGTAAQNTQLLALLRGQTAPSNALANKLDLTSGGSIPAESIAKGVTSTVGVAATSTGNSNLDNVLSSSLSGVDGAIMNFFSKQQELAKQNLATAEARQKNLEQGFATLSSTSSQQELANTLEQFQIKGKMDALNSIKEQVLKKQQALSLAISQEEQKIVPLSIIGRKQQVLKDQTAGELASLAVTAQVLQDDLSSAQSLAQLSFNALQQDKARQLDAYQMLLNFNRQDIVSLKADEKDAVNNQISALQNAIKTAEKNKDEVFALIASNPIAASKANVSLTESRDTAYAKMLPFIIQQAEAVKVLSGGSNKASSGSGSEQDKEVKVDPEVTSWVNQINAGKATISSVPAKLKTAVVSALDATKPPVDAKTVEIVSKAQQQIDLADNILNSPGLSGAVGPNWISRLGPIASLTGATSNFIASVEQLTNQQTLNSLLALKQAGGTLGALNESELILLQNAASKINNWAKKDENGRVVAYQASEKDFRNEINRIKSLAQKAIINSGVNSSDPLGVGITGDPLKLF